jgi:hypothetical protein
MDPTTDVKKMETIYNGLDETLKTVNQVKVKPKLTETKSPSAGASVLLLVTLNEVPNSLILKEKLFH